MKDCWYRNTRFTNLVCRIIAAVTEHTYRVELYSIEDNKKLGNFTTYFYSGDKEWELYEPSEDLLQEMQKGNGARRFRFRHKT